MRDELIASAVTFLQHASVSSISGEHKAAFLREKGLSEVEITEAFRRLGLPVPTASVSVSAAPAPAPPSSSFIMSALKWIAAAGVGASAYRFLAGPAVTAPLTVAPLAPAADSSDDEVDIAEPARVERFVVVIRTAAAVL
jgi:hypothetical protein